MKKKIVLVTFLLMLYVLPVFQVSAVYGDASSDSIQGFEETLPDNILFYPDAIVNDTIHFADSGDTNYEKTFALDADWYLTDGADLSLVFTCAYSIEGFSYHFYAKPTGASLDVEILDGGSYETLFTDSAEDWYNGTYYFGTSTNEITLNITAGGISQQGIDYADVQVSYMTLADSNHYAESFTDVSDWSFESETSGLPSRSFTSDGDVLTFEIGYDDTSNEAAKYGTTLPNGLSVTDYIEFRYICSASGGSYLSTALMIYLDGIAIMASHVYSATWTPSKIYIGTYCSVAPTNISIEIDDYGNTHASDSGYVKMDYLRINPSNESGWQNDGSTTEGFNERTLDISTDGDLLNISNSGSSDYCELWFDTTTTVATISDSYYRFFEINVVAVKASTNTYLLRVYDSDGTYSNLYGYGYATGTLRFNLASVASLDDIKYFRIYVVADQWLTVNYTKLYSIADYTLSQSGSCTTTDVLYCDSGTLVSDKTTGTYIALNHDPILSVDTEYYTACNISIPEAFTWLGGGTYGFAITTTVSGGSDTYFDDTAFLLEEGTLTDFTIYCNGRGRINSIKFIDSHMWQEVDSVTVYIFVPFDYWAVNMGLVFFGLALVVIISCLIAVKIRDHDFDKNKMMILFFLWFLGWGLFLGGMLIG